MGKGWSAGATPDPSSDLGCKLAFFSPFAPSVLSRLLGGM
jgi:hypothetical protein